MKLEDIQKHTLIRIVDDDTDLLEATELMLTFSGWRVKCYARASDFLAGDAPSDPGCLILDIRMPDMTGIELQAELNARHYDLPIIVLTGHANVDIAVTTFRAGAFDFLQKPVDEEALMDVIARAAGESLRKKRGIPVGEDLQRRLETLTAREATVLQYMREGLNTRGIAERLGISERTVYDYRTVIYQKLGTKDVDSLP